MPILLHPSVCNMSCCHHCCSNCCCSSSCSVPAEQRHLCLTLFSNAQLRWQLREFPLKPPVPVQLPAAPFLFLTLSLLSKGWKPGPQCKVKGFNLVGKMWRGCKTGDYRCWRRRAGDDWWNIRLGRAGSNGELWQRRKDEAGKNPNVSFQEPECYHMLPCAGEWADCLKWAAGEEGAISGSAPPSLRPTGKDTKLTANKHGEKQETKSQIQANANTPSLCEDDDTTP